MRGHSMVMGVVAIALMSASALAQTKVDKSFTSVSDDCAGIRWSDEALKQYPTIASACQSVEQRDGKTYVKFSGTVRRNVDRGKELEIAFKDGNTLSIAPPPQTVLYVNGRKTPIADLRRGDELNFYISQDRFTAQLAQDETPAPQYVAAPIVHHEYVNQAQTAAALPHTASDLPLVALSGALLLALGAGLTVVRTRRS